MKTLLQGVATDLRLPVPSIHRAGGSCSECAECTGFNALFNAPSTCVCLHSKDRHPDAFAMVLTPAAPRVPQEMIDAINEIDAARIVNEVANGGHFMLEGCRNHRGFCRGWSPGAVGCTNCPRPNSCTQNDHFTGLD